MTRQDHVIDVRGTYKWSTDLAAIREEHVCRPTPAQKCIAYRLYVYSPTLLQVVSGLLRR